jgi:adenylate cyclase
MLGPVLQRSSRAMLPLTDSDPDLDNIRDDPRFQAMVEGAKKRLGITADAQGAA